MKTSTLAIVTFLLFTSITVAQSPDLKVRYDKFDDVTTISAEPIFADDYQIALLADLTHQGEKLREPVTEFRIIIVSTPAVWPTLRTPPPLKLIVDSQRFELSNNDFRELGLQALRGVHMYGFGLTVSPSDFKTLACAKSVAVKFGLNDFELSLADITKLKLLLNSGQRYCD